MNLTSLVQDSRTKKATDTLLILLGILVIIPFLYHALYDYPISDDYGQSILMKKFSFLDRMVSYYTGWGGRWTLIITLNLFDPANIKLNRIFDFIVILFYFGSTIFFVNTYLVKRMPLAIFFGSSIAFYSLSVYPIFYDFLYWNSGASHYGMGYSYLLIFLSLLNYYNKNNKNIYFNFLLYMVLLLLTGSFEVFAILCPAILFTVIIIKYFIQKDINFKFQPYIVLFIIAATLSIANVFSPGNANRSRSIKNKIEEKVKSGEIEKPEIQPIKMTKKHQLTFFSYIKKHTTSNYGYIFFLLSFLLCINKKTAYLYDYRYTFILCLFFIFVVFIIAIYYTKSVYPLPNRAIGSIYRIQMMILYLISFILITEINITFFYNKLIYLIPILLSFLFLLRPHDRLGTFFFRSFEQLEQYSKIKNKEIAFLEKHKNKENCVIHLREVTLPTYFNNFDWAENHWMKEPNNPEILRNSKMAHYYNVKKVVHGDYKKNWADCE